MTTSAPVVDVPTHLTPDRSRRTWIAAVLTLIISGLGQLYAGRGRRAVLIFLLANAASVVFIVAWIQRPTFGLLAVALLLVFGAKIAFTIDAARVARAAPVPFVLNAYNRWYVYVIAWFVAAFVISPRYENAVRGRRFEAFRLPSGSMERTWMAGDFLPDSDYFVLGDNRERSMDSRMKGFVPAGAIFAHPLFVYWSWDADNRSMRWNRFGLTPR